MHDKIFRFGMGLLAAAAALALIQFLVSCSSVRYMTSYRDSVRIVNHVDTMLRHDSVYVHEFKAGDTVYITKDRTRYVYRYVGRTDTAYITKRDSFSYPVTRKVTEWKYQTRWYDGICHVVTALCASILAGWLLVRYVNRKS